MLTDSGGLQEETTALGVPCVTIRENTERPITVELGTNVLAGTTKEGILKAYRAMFCESKDCFNPSIVGWQSGGTNMGSVKERGR